MVLVFVANLELVQVVNALGYHFKLTLTRKHKVNNMSQDHSQSFNEHDFFSKIRKVIGKVPFIKEVVVLYFCLIDNQTPFLVKAAIISALGYFIFPLDVIPDFTPVIGYTDDAGVIAGVTGSLAMHIKPEHHRQAEEWLLINR